MLQEGFITFFEIIKAILMGIVEGITEWLPISSTGHMILVEQVVKFNASEEFMSMFRVVIQLGAILAVVVLFWNKLWPFGLRQGKVISKPSVWNLWFKVVAATLPVLVISPLDDWMEEHFYNYITVAAMLILYGVLFLVVENRRTTPRVTKLEQISYRDALLIGVWQCLAIIPGTSRSGATIVGGLLLGLSRACVAEFTFYLAIPVMAGELAQGGQVRGFRCIHHRHRDCCVAGGLRCGLCGQPCSYPLPDGLCQAPRLQVLRHLPHRAGCDRAGCGSHHRAGIKENLNNDNRGCCTAFGAAAPYCMVCFFFGGLNPLRHRCAMPPPPKGGGLFVLTGSCKKSSPFRGSWHAVRRD